MKFHKPSHAVATKGLTAMAAVVLAGCTAAPSALDAQKVELVDNTSQPLIKERLIDESQKLRELQDELRERIQDIAEVEVVEEVAAPSALDMINVTLKADNVDARNLFRAIADQARLNLVLPTTLSEQPRNLSLHLTDVSGTVAFNQILKALDLSGRVNDEMLEVSLYDEAVFDLDFLLTMSSASFNAGGDVFGAGALSGGEGASSTAGGNGLASSFAVSGNNTNDVNPYDQIESMLTRLLGLDREEDGFNSDGNTTFTLNRTTGTLFVRARPSKVATVSELVGRYQSVMGRQVLIEAQILDVELNDQFSYGVDWNILRDQVAMSYGGNPMTLGSISSAVPDAVNAGRSVIIPSTTLGSLSSTSFGITRSTANTNVGLDLMKTFGTVHILSNPSIRVRNTQPAVVSVGSNIRFVSQSSSNTQNNTAGQLATTANVVTSSVFDGVMLGVIPFVSEDGSIHLTINPMQTSVQPNSLALVDVGSEQNPLKISLPQVDFKGITTSLSVNDGDMVVLGGLISEGGNRSKDGLPGIADIPMVGELFGGQSRSVSARELVLILRVTRL